MSCEMPNHLIKIGRMSNVHLHEKNYVDIPAKIDTGADASSIDASYIKVNEDGTLDYILFQKGDSFYDGRIHKTSRFRIKVVKSSTGHTQIRYTVMIPIHIEGKKIIGTFTLTNRNKNTFPILIGSKMLKNKFIVDVSYDDAVYSNYVRKFKDPDNTLSSQYTLISQNDPVRFYKEVYLNQETEI